MIIFNKVSKVKKIIIDLSEAIKLDVQELA